MPKRCWIVWFHFHELLYGLWVDGSIAAASHMTSASLALPLEAPPIEAIVYRCC